MVTDKVIKMLMLLSVMLMSACDNQKAEFDAIRTKTLQNPDSWQAWQQLNAEAEKACPEKEVLPSCDEKLKTDYRNLSVSLYRKALDQHSHAALTDLFMRDEPPAELKSRMPAYAAELITVADHSSGDRASVEILATAAHVLELGKWVQKDSVRAAAFFARAWLAYDTQAPASLSRLYSEQHDEASALLWRLRCTGDCDSSNAPYDNSASLSPRQILRIQSLAQDRSIITVNGQASWEEK
ncbi:hypothetical protein [Pantoea vagans]|uniref:hypothetical protein n=1 Tax=Pantoea vagans TaxID=470934 RepID=UPI0023AF6A97|nr:hypothetical protein [Pantoea vagans]MDE8558882.1 hypothetical protein [Pantoea vagans]MDE8578887.1 hypothetical protein [Pantoea vagans]